MSTSDPSVVLSVSHFKKTFYVGLRRKLSVAAQDISLEVHKGEVFGFLGPNGAGKTTTIKAVLGLIKPDAGEIRVVGSTVDSGAWRAHVGYMPEHPTFYDYLTGKEMVTWFARLSGMNRTDAEKEAVRMLQRVGLGDAMDRRIRGYSKGMVQRAGLAQAMVGSPQLLILDEPMTGLDPIGRREIRELILSLKAEGKTVFYSTHILPDVEMTCDRVSIINKGTTVQVGRLDEILNASTERGVEVVLGGVDDAQAQAILDSGVKGKLSNGKLELFFEEADAAWTCTQGLIASGATLRRFEPHHDDLESIFMRSLDGSEAKS